MTDATGPAAPEEIRRRKRSFAYFSVALLVTAAALTAGLVAGGPSSGRHAPPTWLAQPLTTTFTTTQGTWAIVAMGDLSDPANTFWQVFFRKRTGMAWRLVTPPGVADNGGISARTDGGRGEQVGIAFGTTNLLEFSPVATTLDDGLTWSAGIIPFGTARVPDVFVPGGPQEVAAIRASGDAIEAGSLSDSRWSVLLDSDEINGSNAGKECEASQITALSGSFDDLLVGTTCTTPGTIGIFSYRAHRENSSLRNVAPHMPASDGVFSVLRLSVTTQGSFALVDSRETSHNLLFGLWMPLGSEQWRVTTGLDVAAHFDLLATGSGPEGSVSVEVASETGKEEGFVSEAGGSWRQVPNLPSGSAALSLAPDHQIDALSVNSSVFEDWRLEGTRWVKAQHLDVPIQYGSSS